MLKQRPLWLDTAHQLIAHKRTPGQLILQVTSACNASCPQCEMRISSNFPRNALSKHRAMQLIDEGANRGIQTLSLTGGEPFLILDEVIVLANHAHKNGYRYIRTGTNGYFLMQSDKADFPDRMHRLAEKLAASPIRNIWISLDSANLDVHEKMRGLPGVGAGFEKALHIFEKYKLYLSANLGITRMISGDKLAQNLPYEAVYGHFTKGFEAFYSKAIALGFTTVNACYPMSVQSEHPQLQAAYGASSASEIVSFTQIEKKALYRALYNTIPKFRSSLRIFTPRTSLLMLMRQLESPQLIKGIKQAESCRGGLDYFYVDATDGLIYPCGFRGGEAREEFPTKPSEKHCTACEWECFRDPSEFTGTLLGLINQPLKTINTLVQDTQYRKTMLEDLRYYKACDYFDGRQALNLSALAKFHTSI